MRQLVQITTVVALALLVGCAAAPPPTDNEMVSAPTGLWIGSKDAGQALDIQASRDLKYVVGNQEFKGKWKANGENSMTADVDGQSYEMPYTRSDLTLSITLPGQSAPTEFTQM